METKRILIVDDDLVGLRTLSERLLNQKFQVLEASDGLSAMTLAKKEQPDLIVLDIMMKGQDGMATYSSLKQGPATKNIPIIFLSALAQNEVPFKYHVGSHEHYWIVGKPYQSEDLLKIVREALSESPNPTEFDREASMETKARQKILIIEDDQVNAETLTERLVSSGFEVHAEQRGTKGLNYAADYRPDLVILDLILPDMSGYEVCERLRAMDFSRRLPILMLTGLRQPTDQLFGFNHGADAYMTKPYESAELLKTVELLLGA